MFDGKILARKNVSIETFAQATPRSKFHVAASIEKDLIQQSDQGFIICADPNYGLANIEVGLAHCLIRPLAAGCRNNGTVSKTAFKNTIKGALLNFSQSAEVVWGESLAIQLIDSHFQTWELLQTARSKEK